VAYVLNLQQVSAWSALQLQCTLFGEHTFLHLFALFAHASAARESCLLHGKLSVGGPACPRQLKELPSRRFFLRRFRSVSRRIRFLASGLAFVFRPSNHFTFCRSSFVTGLVTSVFPFVFISGFTICRHSVFFGCQLSALF